MRASRMIGLIGVAGGVAAFAARRAGVDRRMLLELLPGRGDDGGTTAADELPGEPEAIARARRIDAAQDEADATALEGEALTEIAQDNAALVHAERELLTVEGDPGEDHRRRDQTAGVAAQDIAAAQVRSRRYGVQDEDEDVDG